MKYKTFRALVITSGIALTGGGLALLLGGAKDAAPAPTPAPVVKAVAPKPAPPPPPVAKVDPGHVPLRPFDQHIIDRSRQPFPTARLNDAFPGETEKVSFFAKPGGAVLVRAKVDLDRDGHWDEEWLFEQVKGHEKIVRKVAQPGTTEQFKTRYELTAGTWVLKE
jgi:hypothetical protein